MEEALILLSRHAVLAIDAMALIVIVFGTVQAFVAVIGLLLSPGDSRERQEIWLRYARWLVAGLTFQLAADIVETSTTTSWEAIARLGAIAVIRTFLNYFLERDLAELRAREARAEARSDIHPQGDLHRRLEADHA